MTIRPILQIAGSVALASLLATTAVAQSAGDVAPLRTPHGHPDLGGIWDFRTVTPLERPEELGDQAFFSEEESAEYAAERVLANNADLNREQKKQVTTDRGPGERHAREPRSRPGLQQLLVGPRGQRRRDPAHVARDRSAERPNPPLTEAGAQRAAERLRINQSPTEGPEDRPLGERCITGFNSGPPMLPAAYNMNVQIFQTPDHVVLLNEMVHNARIIPLDGSDHGTLPQWTGVSRGHWDGDTLVVETKNYLRETSFRNSSKNLHLMERIRRLDEDTLVYTFTVTDPSTWTAPWTVELPMRQSDLPIFEYACQEGNYGMDGTLTGARAIERRAAGQ